MTGVMGMRKAYQIVNAEDNLIRNHLWKKIPEADIANYPWDSNGYMPKAKAQVFYTKKAFHVLLKAYEKSIRATCENMNDFVHKDSCIEFFLSPNPDYDKRYFNFEFNPLGTLYLSIGDNRFNRILLDKKYYEIFNIESSESKRMSDDLCREFWSIEFSIPFSFIREFFGELNFGPGTQMKGNFYKCGDDTEYPHFGCWSNIINDVPDFHRPEFFGDMILE